MALTCHNVVLPSISIHPRVKCWEIYGISPSEATNLPMNMPSRLDHLETIASYKEDIKKSDTAAHSIIRMRLRDPQDFINPSERTIYKLTEKRILEVRYASGLRQQYPPATPSVSFGWALINAHSSRLSKNDLLPIEDAPYQLRIKFEAFSGQILPSSLEPPPPRLEFIHVGKTDWLHNGYCTYKGKTETVICSGKADEKGHLRKTITCEHTIQPVGDDTFGKAGDSGAAILEKYGAFVGLYFASNSYTGSGFLTAAKDLFADIKRMTSAEEVDLLPIV